MLLDAEFADVLFNVLLVALFVLPFSELLFVVELLVVVFPKLLLVLPSFFDEVCV